MLQGLGAHVVDADAISRRLTAAGGGAIAPLRVAFGPDLITPDGALDRERMRARVFAQPQERLRLEGILHPLITQACLDEASRAAAGQVVVFEVPLLVEAGRRWLDRVDRVLVVDCSRPTQIRRVMARSGWDLATVERVIDQQATREARRAVADAVILNEDIDLEQLRDEVCKVWASWGLPAS